MPTKLEGLIGVLTFLEGYEESDSDFLSTDSWEGNFDPQAMRRVREQFLSQSPTQYQKARWRAGMFDSVTSHFVIGSILVKNEWNNNGCIESIIPGPPLDVSFVYSLRQQNEAFDRTERNHASDWEISDGALPQARTVAWREKLDGVPIVSTGGRLSCCFLSSPCLEDYAGELTSSGVYQLWPYTISPMPFDHEMHEWRPFSASYRHVKEGIVLLGRDGREYRIKRNPSIELKDHHPAYPGVWEYEHLYEGLRPKRPRTREPATNLSVICKVLSLDDIIIDPHDSYEIKYHVSQSITVDTTAVYIPSRYIPMADRERHGDVVSVSRPTGVTSYIAGYPEVGPSIIGSKVLLVREGKYYVFKDNEKKWDLIGGTLINGESTIVTLRRECLEEANLQLGTNVVLQGYTREGAYMSAVYSYNAPTLPVGFTEYSPALDGVPWLSRLMIQCLSSRNGYKHDLLYDTNTFSLSSYGITVALRLLERRPIPRKCKDTKFVKHLPSAYEILSVIHHHGGVRFSDIGHLYSKVDMLPSTFIESISYLSPLTQQQRRSWWDYVL
jgi:hypothetical protein